MTSPETSFQFDEVTKQKYFEILKSKGLATALTTLHRDYERLENQSFEGIKGYQPQMWENLKPMRDFSRELWDLAAEEQAKNPFSR